MPLYKYKCTKCDKTTEHLSKLGDTSKQCDCGHKAVKVFSIGKPLFQVNGGGAYNPGVLK